jgi:hypothetical protein
MTNPDRLALFLVGTGDEGVATTLASLLRRHGFDVRPASRSGGEGDDPSGDAPGIELDYLDATFSIFNIVGDAPAGIEVPLPEDDGHRVPAPGAYAVIMAGVGDRESPEGVGSIQLDERGEWLRTVVRWLFEMGWTK